MKKKSNIINISRLKEACLWLQDDEAYMAYYENMVIRITPALGDCFQFTLYDKRANREIRFIMLPEEFNQYFSEIVNRKFDELWNYYEKLSVEL